MLRFTIAILLAMLASGPAMSAERAVARHGVHRRGRHAARRTAAAAVQIPNHHFVWPATLLSKDLRSSLYGYDSEVLFTPEYADVSSHFALDQAPRCFRDIRRCRAIIMGGLLPTITSAPTTAAPHVNYWNACPTPAAFTVIAREFYGFAVRIAALLSRASRLLR